MRVSEDDSGAIDSYEEFVKQVKECFNIDFNEVKNQMKQVYDLGDTFIYHWENYKITNEIGLYSVEVLPIIELKTPPFVSKFRIKKEYKKDGYI